MSGVRLFIGGHAGTIQGEREDLAGDRCFSAALRPYHADFNLSQLIGILDSGAFSDRQKIRLTATEALRRQLAFEQKASKIWGGPWQALALVSYDHLIDEVWVYGQRQEKRWSIAAAERAVETTIQAAAYLTSQRQALAPRRLILACQGIDAQQYEDCVAEILKVAQPQDWIGLGGWAMMGRFTSWLPEFWAACYQVIPRIAAAGIQQVHIFGVLYLPALGGLLWLCDRYGLNLSTDSTRPILESSWSDSKKAGQHFPYWRDNVAWWKSTLASLRQSRYYTAPPRWWAIRQLSLLEVAS